MNDQEKLKLAREALERAYNSFASAALAQTFGAEASWKEMGAALAAINVPSTERAATQPAGEWTAEDQREQEYFDRHPATPSGSTEQPASASVDGPGLHQLLFSYHESFGSVDSNIDSVIAHIDAWGAQQREAAEAKYEHLKLCALKEIEQTNRVHAACKAAEKERDDLRAQAFKWVSALNECARLLDVPAGVLQTDVPKYLSAQLARPVDLAKTIVDHVYQHLGFRNHDVLVADVQALLTGGTAPVVGQEPIGEVVMFGADCKEVSWANGKMPEFGVKLYAAPQPAAKADAPAIPNHHGSSIHEDLPVFKVPAKPLIDLGEGAIADPRGEK